MTIDIIYIGKKQPTWLDTAIQDYGQRLQPYCKINWRNLPLAKRNTNLSRQQILTTEANHINKHLKKAETIIALEETGQLINSHKLAQQLADWQLHTSHIAFVIGGPDGLDPTILRTANWQWSLSPLTLPHHLARLIVIEQLYRGFSILDGKPYHRA